MLMMNNVMMVIRSMVMIVQIDVLSQHAEMVFWIQIDLMMLSVLMMMSIVMSEVIVIMEPTVRSILEYVQMVLLNVGHVIVSLVLKHVIM